MAVTLETAMPLRRRGFFCSPNGLLAKDANVRGNGGRRDLHIAIRRELLQRGPLQKPRLEEAEQHPHRRGILAALIGVNASNQVGQSASQMLYF